jgi:hypothetical protein
VGISSCRWATYGRTTCRSSRRSKHRPATPGSQVPTRPFCRSSARKRWVGSGLTLTRQDAHEQERGSVRCREHPPGMRKTAPIVFVSVSSCRRATHCQTACSSNRHGKRRPSTADEQRFTGIYQAILQLSMCEKSRMSRDARDRAHSRRAKVHRYPPDHSADRVCARYPR